MKHARSDYDPIQDPRGLIPEDEPVFLLRAQDLVAPQIVDAWALSASAMGAKKDIVQAAFHQAGEMRRWQSTGYKKIPDLPKSEV